MEKRIKMKKRKKNKALKVEGVLVGAIVGLWGGGFWFPWDRMHRREAMRNGLAL